MDQNIENISPQHVWNTRSKNKNRQNRMTLRSSQNFSPQTQILSSKKNNKTNQSQNAKAISNSGLNNLKSQNSLPSSHLSSTPVLNSLNIPRKGFSEGARASSSSFYSRNRNSKKRNDLKSLDNNIKTLKIQSEASPLRTSNQHQENINASIGPNGSNSKIEHLTTPNVQNLLSQPSAKTSSAELCGLPMTADSKSQNYNQNPEPESIFDRDNNQAFYTARELTIHVKDLWRQPKIYK